MRPTLVPMRQRWMTWRDYETMGSTDRELPYIGREEEPLGTWVGVGAFAGEARLFDERGDIVSESVQGTWEGVVALTIVGQDVLGIVAPPGTDNPAVWFWVTRSHLVEVTSEGAHQPSAGSFPITIRGRGWQLRIRETARLEHPCWLATHYLPNSLQTGGERSLLDALGAERAAAASLPHPARADTPEELRAVLMRSVPSGAALTSVRERLLELLTLGMGGTNTEVPFDLNETTTPVGTWIGIGMFVGDVHPLTVEVDAESKALGVVTEIGEAETGTLSGPTALTIVGGRVLGIVAPESGPALWLAIAKDEITGIDAEGSRGLVRKRPEAIGVQTDQWSLVLNAVARMYPPCTAVEARRPPRYRRKPRTQPWQEASLLEALRG